MNGHQLQNKPRERLEQRALKMVEEKLNREEDERKKKYDEAKAKEMEECTFRPKINEIKGNRNRKINHMSEKAEELLKWAADRDKKIADAAIQIEAEEAKARGILKLPVKDIEKRSERLFKSHALLQLKRERLSREQNICTFQPDINKKSQELANNKKNRLPLHISPLPLRHIAPTLPATKSARRVIQQPPLITNRSSSPAKSMPRVEKSKPLRIPESKMIKSRDKNTNNKNTKRTESKTDDRTIHNDQGLEREDEPEASDNYDFIRTVEKMKQMEKQIEQNLFEAEPFNVDDDTQFKIQNQVNVVTKPQIDRKVSYKKINDKSLNKIPIKKGKENQVSVRKALTIEDQNKIELKNK